MDTSAAPPCGSDAEPKDYPIREARRSDIPDITRLNAQLGYPDSSQVLALRLGRILRDRRNHRVFVAFAYPSRSPVDSSNARPRKAVIGWIHVFTDKLLTVGPRAEIGGIVVDDLLRSRGVGAALLRRAELWARSRKVSILVIHTNVVRTDAHRFYEKCGYKLLKQSKVYIKEID